MQERRLLVKFQIRAAVDGRRTRRTISAIVVLLLMSVVTSGVQAFSFAAAASTATVIESSKPSSSSSILQLSEPSSVNHADETDTVVVASKKNNAYHLIWSPGAWKKFIYTSAALMVLPRLLGWIFTNGSSSFWFGSGLHNGPLCHQTASSKMISLWNNVALPLVASSCCLLQLAMNVLAVGCAGWNKILGPVRPYFLAWLLVASVQPPLPSRWVLMGRAVVALLPEALDWYNNNNNNNNNSGNVMVRRIQANPANTILDTNQPVEMSDMSSTTLDEITINLPTMGCVACIHSVNGALRNVQGVVFAKSQLNPSGGGGSATIQIRDGNTEAVQNTLIQAVANAGFPGASIARPDIIPNKNEQEEAAASTQKDRTYNMVDEVTLEIPTMGCGACIQSIDSALKQVPGVLSAESQLHPPFSVQRGGTATVRIAVGSSSADAHEQLLRAVADAGFDGATVTRAVPSKKQQRNLEL